MTTARTLVFILLALIGFAMATNNALSWFREGASDGAEGSGKKGCLIGLAGLALLCFSMWELAR